MKILKSELKQIIKEELSAVLEGEELNELAASPFEPDPGSVNWCEEQRKLYYNLFDQAYGSVQRFSSDLQSQARDIKTKMEANGCPDTMAPREPQPQPVEEARVVAEKIGEALYRIKAEYVVQGADDRKERAEALLEPYLAIDNGTASPEDFAEFARRHPEIEDKFEFASLVLSLISSSADPHYWQYDD